MNGEQSKFKRGFTLIELLVVISIISILAAILFPVFARARENARRSGCASNMKQIGLALMQYTQDFDEKFPRPAPIEGGMGDWASLILPYMKSVQIFRCPSHHQAPGASIDVGPVSDYAYSAWFGFGSSDARAPQGVISQATLTKPSLTVVIAENFTYDGRNWIGSAGDWRSSGPPTPRTGGEAYCNWMSCTAGLAQFQTPMAQMHLGGVNYTFTDGHVKWYKSANEYESAVVWNVVTPGSMSGNSPTFNPIP